MDSNYYSIMHAWFEKCGIISNIRTQLRQNLVNALKHKDLGLCKNKEARSAKQYVYDMLIAEYLFSHNYSFTLSIFASEVPLLVNFCNNVSQHSDGDIGGTSKSKLQNDYIVHTLETLGIDPKKPDGKHIISNYVNSEASLLLAILSSIASLVLNSKSPVESFLFDKETQTDLALGANFTNATKMQMMKKKIMREKQFYDEELKTKENKLKQQASNIKYQLSSLNAKVEKVQNLMQSLRLKEKQLNEKESRLQKERDSYRKIENDLKKLQQEFIKMQKQMSQDVSKHGVQNNVKNTYVQTDLENRTVIDEYKVLQQEKLELTVLVQEQRSMIEQITQRSAQLSHQLEEIRLLQSVQVPSSMVRVISANAIVSESSSTEDILQDAKMRLKRLEEESSKADQYFCNFVSTSS